MSNALLQKNVLTVGVVTTVLAVAVIAWLTMRQTGPGSLLPHGYCFTWNPTLLWTHVFSDLLIGLAYLTIPLTLLHLVRRRADMPFNWMVLLFATFIVSCGATHWIDVWTVWNPDYYLAGSVKVVTAAASLLTAGALIHLVPRVLAIPSASQLAQAHAALQLEIEQRRGVEDELRQERAALEIRVSERTRELELANAAASEARAAAEAANLQKDRFLAKVSHELRTPLQSMLTWAEVLRYETLDLERARQAADRIAHNVHLQARLIDDLLDISRILNGKLSLELERTELRPLLDRVVDMLHGTAVQHGVTIVVDQTAALPAQLTDPTRLEQIVWNLLSNAVRASRRDGTVHLSLECHSNELLLRVRDDGVGIAAEDLPFIFEPFQQCGGTSGRHTGLGLGLAIVRQLVHLFGGDIKAFSAGTGQGAAFHVRLPLQTDFASHEDATKDETLTAGEVSRLRGVRIVYVEDQEDIARSGALMLSSLGLLVSTCRSFGEALQHLSERDCDLLLTDLHLDDGHTGPELLQALRRLPHGHQIPAVMLSAYGSDEDKWASNAAGFAEHLVKPMETIPLVRALLAALQPGKA